MERGKVYNTSNTKWHTAKARHTVVSRNIPATLLRTKKTKPQESDVLGWVIKLVRMVPSS